MKLGLGHSYDRVQVLSKKSRAYIDLTKPASSVGVAMGLFISSLFYFYYYGIEGQIISNLSTILAVSGSVFLAHSASQAMNMAEDAEMDRNTPHKQNRPIPAGIVSEEEARAVAWVGSGWALSVAFLVSWQYGVLVGLLLFFGIFYNLDPIRAKERIISIPWQAASRGLLSFPAVWVAYGDVWQVEPWILGLFMFFYVLGFQNSADIIDAPIDKEYGISTFVVEYGLRRTLDIALLSMSAMALIIPLAVVSDVIPQRFLFILGILPFCFVMLYYMWAKPQEVSDLTGNHPAWLWFYIGMVMAVSIPLTVEMAL